MDLKSIPTKAAGVFDEALENERLLYRIGAHKAYHLNETAVVVWTLCDGSRTVEEIIDFLSEAYPDAQTTLRAEVIETLTELKDENIIIERAASALQPT
jgi:hypothetical protein